MSVKIARTEFGVEILHTFDGGRWLWNEEQSWLEYIEAGMVMPKSTSSLPPRLNNLYEAVMTACTCEARRVYELRKLEEAD